MQRATCSWLGETHQTNKACNPCLGHCESRQRSFDQSVSGLTSVSEGGLTSSKDVVGMHEWSKDQPGRLWTSATGLKPTGTCTTGLHSHNERFIHLPRYPLCIKNPYHEGLDRSCLHCALQLLSCMYMCPPHRKLPQPNMRLVGGVCVC